MTTASPGYATTKQRELAAAIRRDRRGGAHLVVLARRHGLPIDVITRVVQARSVEGAAKVLAENVNTFSVNTRTDEILPESLQTDLRIKGVKS